MSFPLENIPIDDDEYDKLKSFLFVLAIIVFFLYKHFYFDNTVLKNVEMEPFSEPIQEMLTDSESFTIKTKQGTAKITPIADYKIYGRVLDKHYRPSRLQGAAVYPYDVTIFFGPFKHKEASKAINVKMAGTTSYWTYSASAYRKHLYKYVKGEREVMHYFTNNHLCPANNNIKRGIQRLKKQDVVYIEGYLVKFEHKRKDGKFEKGISSTSRNDKENAFRGDNGYGSCEQIYVTRVVSKYGDYR